MLLRQKCPQDLYGGCHVSSQKIKQTCCLAMKFRCLCISSCSLGFFFPSPLVLSKLEQPLCYSITTSPDNEGNQRLQSHPYPIAISLISQSKQKLITDRCLHTHTSISEPTHLTKWYFACQNTNTVTEGEQKHSVALPKNKSLSLPAFHTS